ncbi:MAG TPA: AMP-binding protein [Deltaproteobacteria bacterium]|nr:AMP-binding protein [Deltaproteobacteria bacterium]HOM29115.1 AMP-binding protein [Deltaproteobacteria bacterium]HPP81184.1 AMP-binding protein [Deltaproteobacteria bacterium]
MGRYLDDLETQSMQMRAERQSRLLADMVRRGYERSHRVRAIFDESGLSPADIRSVSDLERLPVINRERIVRMEEEEPPYGGLADVSARIERIFTSPGPVYEPHLNSDDPLWARAYKAAGFGPGDIVLNAFSYHMVAAGLTFHGGLVRVGATVVPSGTSPAHQQVQLIKDLKVTGYTGTPSFLMAIIDKANEMGYDFARDFSLRRAAFAAEPLQPSLRGRFERDFGIDTYQMYGATEVGDVAYECREKNGWHLCEEVIVEIVDPETGKPLGPGELGEVVVTRLNPIFFLFRFGTGDLSRLTDAPCPCGRTSLRLEGIAGRVGEAVKVRGMFVAPSQVKRLTDMFPGIVVQLVVSRSGTRDVLTARIDASGAGPASTGLAERFEKAFQEVCTVRLDRLELVEPGTLAADAKPLLDERTWE